MAAVAGVVRLDGRITDYLLTLWFLAVPAGRAGEGPDHPLGARAGSREMAVVGQLVTSAAGVAAGGGAAAVHRQGGGRPCSQGQPGLSHEGAEEKGVDKHVRDGGGWDLALFRLSLLLRSSTWTSRRSDAFIE